MLRIASPRIAGLALAVLLSLCGLEAAAQDVTYTLVATGLDQPVDVQNARDGTNRLFVVEQWRGIRVIEGGVLKATPFLDLSAVTDLSTRGNGVMGLAFDPAYATNHRFFVSYVRASDGALRVESYTASTADPDVADPASAVEVITITNPTVRFSYGGHIAFGPDGMLFVSTGDFVGSQAQDLTSLWGKLLRLDVRGASGYVVPPDNYWVATGNPTARPEIVARGFQNPLKFSFDPTFGDLYIANAGAADVIFTMPRDYWRSADMNYCHSMPCPPGSAPPQAAVVNVSSATGGVVYRGSSNSALYGHYIYGGFHSPFIQSATHDGGVWYNAPLNPIGPPRMVDATAFGTDESGELYVAVNFRPLTGPPDVGQLYAISAPPGTVPTSRYGRATGQHLDLDGDGRADLLWKSEPPAMPDYIAWFMNGAAPASSAPVALPAAAATPQWPQVWDVGRFHAGSRSDRLWRDIDASYWLDVNDVSGTTTTRIYDAGQGWEVVQGGDFNGDGVRDLLWRNDSLYGVWLMNGASPLGTGMLASPDPGYRYPNVEAAVIGDFDGDGKSDIAWYRRGDGSAAISLMDGLATKASATLFVPSGMPWKPAAGADFNGDGKSDLVWTLPSGALGLWVVDGLAPTGYGVVYWGDAGLTFLLARDLDGDGKADLVFQAADGSTSVWLMDGLAVRQQVTLQPGTGWSVIAADDYDGDGKADLLWQRLPQGDYAVSTSIAPFVLLPLPAAPGAGYVPWR
jgi:glucose/arabinose dehydrogenase